MQKQKMSLNRSKTAHFKTQTSLCLFGQNIPNPLGGLAGFNTCVLVICAYMCCPALFLWCLFAGSRGAFLEVQTSLKESKIESWERRGEVKEGRERGSERRMEIK